MNFIYKTIETCSGKNPVPFSIYPPMKIHQPRQYTGLFLSNILALFYSSSTTVQEIYSLPTTYYITTASLHVLLHIWLQSVNNTYLHIPFSWKLNIAASDHKLNLNKPSYRPTPILVLPPAAYNYISLQYQQRTLPKVVGTYNILLYK